MATTKTTKTNGKQMYRVRDGLVCRMSDSKTYMPGEQLELSEAEFEEHKLVLETEEQYQSRQSGEDTQSTTI